MKNDNLSKYFKKSYVGKNCLSIRSNQPATGFWVVTVICLADGLRIDGEVGLDVKAGIVRRVQDFFHSVQ